MARRINGKTIHPRGSNKKYSQLDDTDAVFEMCTKECPADVARKLGVPYNSLRHLLVKYYNNRLHEVAWKRQPHSNKLRIKGSE
jgi:hypothetical protein